MLLGIHRVSPRAWPFFFVGVVLSTFFGYEVLVAGDVSGEKRRQGFRVKNIKTQLIGYRTSSLGRIFRHDTFNL